jgi:molybdopterin biosynthesis enzyme MoaB
MENIRLKYGQNKPNALLSRGTAGVMGESQVYTLPGSVKAVKEYMHEILKTIEHLIFMLHGIDIH